MSRKNGLGKFFAGAALGAGLGLLFAPKKGSVLRAELKDKIDDLVVKLKDIEFDEVKDEFDKFTQQDATFVFVTNEIVLSGVSENKIQRQFTDLLGWLNQYIASKADDVYFMVSGIPIKIK